MPAANLFGAQFYIAEQLGFRKIVDTTFMMGFLLSAASRPGNTDRYFRALRRAQQEIDLEPERYKHFYARELPADLLQRVDVRRFGPASGSCSSRIPANMYERTQRWMQTWDLLSSGAGGGVSLRRSGARVSQSDRARRCDR